MINRRRLDLSADRHFSKNTMRLRMRWAPAALAVLMILSVFVVPTTAQYDPNAPEPISKLRGSLILGGGGDLPQVVHNRFIELAGGAEARIVLIPTADPRADSADEEVFLADWKSRSVASLVLLHTRSQLEANRARFVEPLKNATGVWFAGDDGSSLVDAYVGTAVERELKALIARGGVVGASSGAAMAMTRVMIAGGSPQASLTKGFDLLPGSVVDVNFGEPGRRNRLLGVLASQPELVGFGIDDRTAMVLRGRQIGTVGVGNVYACVAASEGRPLRIDKIEPSQDGRRVPLSQRADLIALSRSAVTRTMPPFPPEDPGVPNVKSGTLVIVGGGGMPPGLMERFIEFAGGPDAPIVYIPCTEAEQVADEPGIVRRFRQAGAKHVTWIHTKDRNKANTDEEFLAPLKNAGGIWFGGGRQWNLVDSYQNTMAHKLMEDVLKRGGVIGGSSAGASIQSDYMPRGDPLGNTNIIAEGYEKGLAFIKGVAIDQHFTQRNRLPNMTELMGVHPQLLGIGIDESTAIIIQGSVAEAVGRNRVAFYDRRKPVYPDRPDYESVAAGARYDLAERRILDEPPKFRLIATDIIGTWEVTEESSFGTRTQRLRINSNRTGTYGSEEDRYPISDLKIEGEKVSFHVTVKVQEQDFPLYFEGRFEGAQFAGDFRSEPGGDRRGTFTSTKIDEGPSELPDVRRQGRRGRGQRGRGRGARRFPVTGGWAGRMTSDQMPGGGIDVTLQLKLDRQGTVGGTMTTQRGTSEITGGSFNPRTGELTFTRQAQQGEMTFSGTIEGATIKGDFKVGANFTMPFEGRRVQEGQQPRAGEPPPRLDPGGSAAVEKSAVDLRIEELQRKVDQLLRDIRRFRGGGGGGGGLEIPEALTDERVDELMATLIKNMSEIGEEDDFAGSARLHFWRFTNRLKQGTLGPVQQAKVLAYLEGVGKDHLDAEDLIEQQIFTVNRLMIGREAPNIEGRDTKGFIFDLQEYRGNVVALYFSGDWCGPCRGEYPYQRAALQEFKDEPFTVLSVNSDAMERATTYKTLKNLPYRAWYDGGSTSGPIAQRWGIVGWPTMYMLDADGVIRFTGQRGEDMLEAARFLLGEMKIKGGGAR